MPYSQVDEQVVKMSFDNSNFDGNINDSIRALNNLDNKLGTISKNNFSSLTNNIDNLAKTFSVKGQIMFGVLTTLGNKIVNLGSQAFRKLTQGVRDGLGEYKTIIDSTEAIYQNVKQNGNSLQDVNDALDELNDYADKTIYNFGQMTRMIGMFSSAGVGLKSSVSTIKGLSNAAALVGANMQKAQIGWNAVSRAMSSGKFTNMTWRSLELSGIAGKQFNKVITEVARNLNVKGKKSGKDIDGMIKKYGSLRETLQEGWLTNDIFTQAMDIMSGALDKDDLKKKGYTKKQIKELTDIAKAAEEAATKVKTFQQLMDTIGEAIGSGWAQSFRILLGDLEEAKKLYTRISDVISDFIDNNAKIRNKLFTQIINGQDKSVKGGWKSGRDNFRQIIENMLAVVKTFLKSVKTGFLNIFPIDRISAAARKVLDVVQKFTRAFVLNTGEIQKDGQELWDTHNIDSMTDSIRDLIKFFRGLASAVDIAWMAISQPIKAIIKRIPFFNNFFENTNKGLIGIIKKLGQFGDRITAFRDMAKDWEIFGYVVDYFLDNIDELGEKYPILGAILWVFNGIRKAVKGVKDTFKELNIKPLSAAFGLFKMIVTSLWKVLNGVFQVLRSAKNSVDWSWIEVPKKILINFLKTLSDYGRGITTFEQATKKLGGVFGSVFSKIGDIFNKFNIPKKVKTASHEIEKQYSNLNVVIDKTNKNIQSVWDKIKGFFGPVVDLFKSIGQSGEFTFDNIAKKIALIGGGIAAATLSISNLVKTFGKIKIIDNINNLLLAGIDVIKAYQKEAQSRMILNIAIAIGILAVSMTALSFIPYERLENGLVIFTSFMAVLSMTLPPIINALAKFNESLGKTKKQLDQFDVMNNLVNQVGRFGKKIATGLNAKMIGKAFKDVAISIVILVGAIAALVLLLKFEKTNVEKAVKLISHLMLTLAISVGVLTLAMNVFSRTVSTTAGVFSQFSKLAGISGIIISMSLAVLILVGAMAALSKIEAKRLETSFVIVAGLIAFIGVIAVAIAGITANANNFNKLKKITVSVSGAVLAVVAISASFALLVKYISQDQSDAWAKALIVVLSVLGVFGIVVSTMIGVATGIQDAKIFKKLGILATIITTSILAVAAGIYLLSKAGSIPASIVITIGILTAATTAILIFMAAVTAKANGDFSTKFVKVIEGIAFAISAIVASFGILAAGVAALVAAINNVDVSSKDADKASNNVINKLSFVATTISGALPELKKIFYNIGKSVGTVFTSFATGFMDQVISVGDTYNEIAEKFVNLAIDILSKIVGIIYSRKDEIAKIVGQIIDIIGTEITAALNGFFSQNGEGMFKKEDVLKWLGISTLTGTGIHILAENAKDLNALITLAGSAKKALKGLFTVETLRKIFGHIGSIIDALKKIPALFGKIGGAFSKFGNLIGSGAGSVASLGVAILGIIASVTALIGWWKRFTGQVKDSYTEGIMSFKGMEQVLVDGFEKVGRIFMQFGMTIPRVLLGTVSYIVYGVMSVLKKPSEWILKLLSVIDKKNADSYQEMIKQTNMFVDSFKENGKQAFDSFANGWTHVLDDESTEGLDLLDKKFDWKAQQLNKENYERGLENTKYYREGALEGLGGLGPALSDAMNEADKMMINSSKTTLQEHSPSKVSYGIYWNYVLGARDALGEGGKVLTNLMKTTNAKMIKQTLTGTKEMGNQVISGVEYVYDKLGVKMAKREGLHQYNIGYRSYDDEGNVTTKQVKLNRELTESILANKDALLGMSKQSALTYIQEQVRYNGIKANEQEIFDLVNYLYDRRQDKASSVWSSFEALEKATEYSWSNIMSAEEQATMEAVNKQQETNQLLLERTDELSDKIVGKKKEQAQEIIKQDLIQKGMSEEQAEEESKKMIALTVAQQKNKKTITQKGLDAAIDIMQAETSAYSASVKAQTELLNEELEKRAKLQANAAEWQEKAMAGKVNSSNYRDYVDAQRQYIQSKDKVNGLKNELDKIVNAAAERMNSKGLFNAKQFAADYEEAYKQIGINDSKKKSISEALQDFYKGWKGYMPGNIDPSTWNIKIPKTKGTDKKDPKTKNPVDAAKKLKGDLEKNRADLTPTFDLDKLSRDASKANGIVMSSLMAAQNASIGDYINKDSELNPFMKDRWQNVYNFTQNNYSPKALSRIDIYRQTERQLGMSRGF